MENVLVTAVEPQKKKKDRFNIFVGGEYFASLGAEACAVFGVRSGEEISEHTLREAILKDNERYAFDTAVGLISHSMRTRREIETRLEERSIDADAASAAIAKLEGYGYINDAEYAKEYVQSAIRSGKSRRAAQFALREKGIERGVIDAALSEYTRDIEEETAKSSVETLKRSGKDKKQIWAALARRGFDYDIISSVISEEEF
jgi:regulatory protein